MMRFDAPVPKRDVHDVMAEADIFLLPLHRGGLYRWGMSPNKLFDYMAAARPIVIAVDVPCNPVRESGAGLSVPAEDAAAVAEAIKSLIALSPEERWEMGLRGRRYVKAHHDITRLAERFEACLLSVVTGERMARGPDLRRGGGVARGRDPGAVVDPPPACRTPSTPRASTTAPRSSPRGSAQRPLRPTAPQDSR
jgi:hypothetical protein